MDRTKKLLITLLVIGALATIGVGTYATFNATTVNQNNTFASGTVILSNTVTQAAACVSSSGSVTLANSANCSAVISNTSANAPGTAAYGPILLKNTGTINPAALTVQANTCATSNRAADTIHGTAANYCTELDGMLIEEAQDNGLVTSGAVSGAAVVSIPVAALTAAQATPLTSGTVIAVSDGTNVASFVVSATAVAGNTSIAVQSANLGAMTIAGGATVNTPSACRWGSASGSTCAFSNSYTINSGANPLSTAVTLTGGLNAGASRLFVLGLELDPANGDNTYQGLQGAFNLTWIIQ